MNVMQVEMPEGGRFSVRAATAFPPGVRIVVRLDYGIDGAKVLSCETLPEGSSPPRFAALRLFDALDETILRENETLRTAVLAAFTAAASGICPGFKAVYSRISFGRNRLFVRYVSHRGKANLAGAVASVFKTFGVEVLAWPASAREEVALIGAAGLCGRVCCCASFLKKLPLPSAAPPADKCGLCGRRKCCLDFECPAKEDS